MRVDVMFLAGAMMLSGCSSGGGRIGESAVSLSPDADSARVRAIAERSDRARSLESQGDLASALTQWRIVQALAPGDSAVKSHSNSLEAEISHRAGARIQAGHDAARRGESSVARREWLAALALDPSNRDALEALRDIEHRRIGHRQAVHIETVRELTPAVGERSATRDAAVEKLPMAVVMAAVDETATAESGNVGPTVIRHPELVSDAQQTELADLHLRAALEHQRKGEYEHALTQFRESARHAPKADPKLEHRIHETEAHLSDELYEKGVRVYRSDVDEAIRYWKQALSYNDGHAKAKQRLVNAEKVRQTLKNINQ